MDVRRWYVIKTTAYLAGPMRGYKAYNFEAFHEATNRLRNMGLDVLSPAEHDEETGFDPYHDDETNLDLEAAMRWDIQAVLASDFIVLLPGWEKSRGVAIELTVADAVGIPTVLYSDALMGVYDGNTNRQREDGWPKGEQDSSIRSFTG